MSEQLPLPRDVRERVSGRLLEFGERVTQLLALEEDQWQDANEDMISYARNVSRAASDRGSRVARTKALRNYLFPEHPSGEQEEGDHLD